MEKELEYRVPRSVGEAELTEKRSRFIGQIRRVETEEEAQTILREIRAAHYDARHNVYAWLLREGGVSRCSDDGEPQGTGGMPVLEVLRREEVYNVCCVVTRYFGGILLGAGGLTRAYARAAKLALDQAGIAVMRLWTRMELNCGYSWYERVRLEVRAAGGAEEETRFESEVFIRALLPAGEAERFAASISELTAGQVIPRATGAVCRAL